jgi:hypothetical protein
MVSNLDPVSMIFALSLFNNYLAMSAKRLSDSTINVHRNYGGFCIESALMSPLGLNYYLCSEKNAIMGYVPRKVVHV